MNHDRSIRLDRTNTSITFAVPWLGALVVRGRFTDVEGTLRIPNGSVEDSDIAVDVMAASVHTGISLRDHHLRGPQFLDASAHPVISFRSTRVEHSNGILSVRGTLTMRGRQREIRVTCPVAFGALDERAANSGDPSRRNSGPANGSLVRLEGGLVVPRLPHSVGVAHGIQRFNPLLYAIGTDVAVRAGVVVPASELLPALLPVHGP